jgi:hypothetical protein
LILRELAQHEPKSFCLLIDQIAATSELPFWKDISKGLLAGDLTTQCEWPFRGVSKTRRADLAIVGGETPVVLVEVKEFDHLNPENPEQLADYLRRVSHTLGFIYVYRFLPSAEQHRKIERKRRKGWPVAMLSYDQIYNALRNSKDEARALGALICHYLEDIGVGIYREIGKPDGKALAFLMVQMLGFPGQTGMGKLYGEATVQRGPQLLTALLADMEVVGEWVRRSNEKIMKTRCSTRFLIEPWLDHKKLRQSIGHSDDEVHMLPLPGGFQKYVGGGIVWFYAEGSLRDSHLPQGHYLHLQIGFGLELEKGASSVQVFAYTVFYGNQLKSDTYKESGYFKKLPKEQDALDVFRSCLRASTKEALKLTSGSSKALLKKFVIPN